MSLQPLEMKTTKRLSTIGVGTHLCIIYSLYYLKNAAGTEILVDDKYKVMVVVFTKDKGKEHHEQHYVIDGGWRQQQFKALIATAQVKPAVEGESLKIKDAKGHRVWLSIKAIHTVNDGVPVTE